jgi:hypothetical protein
MLQRAFESRSTAVKWEEGAARQTYLPRLALKCIEQLYATLDVLSDDCEETDTLRLGRNKDTIDKPLIVHRCYSSNMVIVRSTIVHSHGTILLSLLHLDCDRGSTVWNQGRGRHWPELKHLLLPSVIRLDLAAGCCVT